MQQSSHCAGSQRRCGAGREHPGVGTVALGPCKTHKVAGRPGGRNSETRYLQLWATKKPSMQPCSLGRNASLQQLIKRGEKAETNQTYISLETQGTWTPVSPRTVRWGQPAGPRLPGGTEAEQKPQQSRGAGEGCPPRSEGHGQGAFEGPASRGTPRRRSRRAAWLREVLS